MSQADALVNFRLDGLTAVVTGGIRNNGFAIARALGEAGAQLALLFKEDWKTAESAAAGLRARGITVYLAAIDLADVENIRATYAAVAAQSGEADILVNCAANRPRAKISEVTVQEWDSVFATNLRAPFFLSQAALPAMVRKGWGRIINIGGIDAYWGLPLRPHNVAAKLGIVGLTRGLANEVARFGVTVNTVVPGAIDSVRRNAEWFPNLEERRAERDLRIPMGHLGTNADVAAACAFLASPAASYITGQELFVSGGAHPLVRFTQEEYPAGDF